MSNHQEDNAELSPQEKQFNDYIRRGDDFLIISIYRHAMTWYSKALKLHINDELVSKKIHEVSEYQHFEKKVIFRILATAVVIIAIVWFIYKLN